MQAKTIGKIAGVVIGSGFLYEGAKRTTDWVVTKYEENIKQYVPNWLINRVADTIPILVCAIVGAYAVQKLGIIDDLGTRLEGNAANKTDLQTAITAATKDMATKAELGQQIGDATKDMATKTYVGEQIGDATKDMATKTYVGEQITGEKLKPVNERLVMLTNSVKYVAGTVGKLAEQLGVFGSTTKVGETVITLPSENFKFIEEGAIEALGKIAADGVLNN